MLHWSEGSFLRLPGVAVLLPDGSEGSFLGFRVAVLLPDVNSQLVAAEVQGGSLRGGATTAVGVAYWLLHLLFLHLLM